MGLDERVVFRCEAAEGMAVPEAGFDVATMLHVGMNIADKAGVFAAVRRALKPGGVFAVYDLMLVGEGEIAFPMPWSSVAESSFVEGPGAYRAALAGAGFDLVAERARVDFALESFELGRRRATDSEALLGRRQRVPLANDRLLGGGVIAKAPHGVPGAALLVLAQPIPGDGAGGENLFGFLRRGRGGHGRGLVRLGAGSRQQGQQEKATFHG
jgi:SAM-dependent methyltransferase